MKRLGRGVWVLLKVALVLIEVALVLIEGMTREHRPLLRERGVMRRSVPKSPYFQNAAWLYVR